MGDDDWGLSRYFDRMNQIWHIPCQAWVAYPTGVATSVAQHEHLKTCKAVA